VRVSPAIPSQPAFNDYVDLQRGWRLTVVTPILKSGGFALRTSDQQVSGNTITLSTGTDFVGYEVAHYNVTGAGGDRVRVTFSSADVTKDGKTEPQPRSVLPLFQLGRGAKYVRLIFLVRISQADHNMAVIAAKHLDALEAITQQVKANPAEGCRIDRAAVCFWIPEGIAIRPERLKTVDGIPRWVDAYR
jgi:hypothetical protein